MLLGYNVETKNGCFGFYTFSFAATDYVIMPCLKAASNFCEALSEALSETLIKALIEALIKALIKTLM